MNNNWGYLSLEKTESSTVKYVCSFVKIPRFIDIRVYLGFK